MPLQNCSATSVGQTRSLNSLGPGNRSQKQHASDLPPQGPELPLNIKTALLLLLFLSHTPAGSCSLLHAVTGVPNYILFLKPIVHTEVAPLNYSTGLIFTAL